MFQLTSVEPLAHLGVLVVIPVIAPDVLLAHPLITGLEAEAKFGANATATYTAAATTLAPIQRDCFPASLLQFNVTPPFLSANSAAFCDARNARRISLESSQPENCEFFQVFLLLTRLSYFNDVWKISFDLCPVSTLIMRIPSV